MHFLGGQKKICIFGGRPWEAKILILHRKMHIFCISLEKTLSFWKNMQKICILLCKIEIFALQGLPPKMHIFLRIFFGLQKNAYLFCAIFLSPQKLPKNQVSCLCPILSKILKISRCSSKFLRCSSKALKISRIYRWTLQGFLHFFSNVLPKKTLEHFNDFVNDLQNSRT